MDILERAQHTIEAHRMLEQGEAVLVALSGGSDSAALLSVLCRLRERYGLRIIAAHVNHHLRETAARDAAFARELCASFGVECVVYDARVREYAKERGISEELAGRALRYAFFDAVKQERGLDKIATAHNRNDVAETVLLHLIRGSGLDGLGGIPPVRGDVIRPLLDCTKAEIEAYCAAFGVPYVVDETNFQTAYTRNKIRLGLMSSIEAINPNFVAAAARNARLCAEEAAFLQRLAEQAYARCAQGARLDTAALQQEELCIRRRVLQVFYKKQMQAEQNLEAKHIDSLLRLIESGKTGNSIDIAGNITARLEYGYLVLERKGADTGFAYRLEPGKRVWIPEIGKAVQVSGCSGPQEGRFCFSADTPQEIWLRSKRDGDVFYPTGMAGRKKLSDLFTDLKLPRTVRKSVPVLTYGEEVVWVAGYRRDRRFLPDAARIFTYAVDIFSDL